MKYILVTHDDLDGAGCAIVFRKTYPSIEVRYCDYGTIDEVSKELWDNRDEYDAIYFADITPNSEYGIKMMGDQKFVLIDHHITREYLRSATRGRVVYDTTKCGTMLSAEYLNINGYDEFIHAVDAYDTWKLDSPYRDLGLNLNLLFDYYKMDNFVKAFSTMRDISSNEEMIIEVLKKIEKDYLAEKLTQGRIKIDNDGNTFFEIHVGERGANVGVLVDDPDFPSQCKYIKAINLNDMGVGLYSKDFDVSEIAKACGGGGHTNAAGYQINK